MFELYSIDNKIPKYKYDYIYNMIKDNYFDIRGRNNDSKEKYNTWVNMILNTKDYYILLYVLNNKIIGFIAFMYHDNYLCLSEIQFDKEHKNTGLLKNLLGEVIRISDKSKYDNIYVTISNNELSKDVFEHIGFKYVGGVRYEISYEDLNRWINNSKMKSTL